MIERGSFDRDFLLRWTNAPLLVRDDTGRFLRESDVVAGGRDDVLHAATADGALARYDATRGAWLDGEADLQLAARTQVRGAGAMLDCRSAFDIYAAAAAQFSARACCGADGGGPERSCQRGRDPRRRFERGLLLLERRRAERDGDPDRPRHLAALHADRQLRRPRRQRARRRGAVRRHLGPGPAVARAARQGARSRGAAAGAGAAGLHHGARCLPRRACPAIHTPCACWCRSAPTCWHPSPIPSLRRPRWSGSNSTSTPTSSSMPPRAMPTSCCPRPPRGSARACARASTAASRGCGACSCARR